MTVVAALAGAILLLSDWSRRGLRFGRRSSSEKSGGLGILFVVLWIVSIILAPIIAQIVSLAVSRQREYLADASGAELTRNPLGLASALEKIAAAVQPTPSIKQGIAHLCIEDPRGRAVNERQGFFADLFATHPPVSRSGSPILREMAYQTGPTPLSAGRRQKIAAAVEEDSQIREVAGLERRRRQLRVFHEHRGHRMVEPQAELERTPANVCGFRIRGRPDTRGAESPTAADSKPRSMTTRGPPAAHGREELVTSCRNRRASRRLRGRATN